MPDQHYARIVGGKVWEIVPFDPAGRFPADWLWVSCPADTKQGATHDAKKGAFTNPPAPEPVEAGPIPTSPYRTTMTPIRFKSRFSLQEQVAIARARAYRGDDETQSFTRDALDVLFGSLDDPRLVEVDVADPSVIGGIEFCRSVGILSDDRAAEIRRGVPIP